jgi:hypothetical protein
LSSGPLLAAAIAVSALNLGAQDAAITNARIIVGTGAVIPSGSIIVRGGKIVSVSVGSMQPAICSRGPGLIESGGWRCIDLSSHPERVGGKNSDDSANKRVGSALLCFSAQSRCK